jgi:hypothetical protein
MQNYGGVWFFHHIPKTAGTSLTRELRFSFPPYRNIHFDQYGPNVDRIQGLSDAVDSFLEDHKTRRFRSCSGHLRFQHVRRLREVLPELRAVTFLRDPVDRLISEYRYCRTEAFPEHEAFRKQYPDIEAFFSVSRNCNQLWSFLAPAAQEGTPEQITSIFNRYSFIGVVEELDTDFMYFTGLSGYPKAIATQANRTKPSKDNEIEITANLRASIAESNAKDMMLYTAVQDVLAPKREEMRRFCAERRAKFEAR